MAMECSAIRLLAVIGLTTLLAFAAAIASQAKDVQARPHIVLIVADDLGWNDVSWHNKRVLTPHLEALAKSGVLLEQSYVQPICTPTRAALMTGRYPYALGRQHGVLWPEEPTGLTMKRQLLPEAMRAAGYDTHAVGKWHLGFCSWDYTPTSRGFDTFFGYYTGAEDYYHHTRSNWISNEDLIDSWISKEDIVAKSSARFGYDFRNNTSTEYSVDGTYSTHVFSSYVDDLLETRDPADPMFLYLPFQSVHSPLQVPEKYTEPFAHIKNHERKIKLGMILAMDEAVGGLVKSLKNSGHYDNSVIVFTTDNGGPTVSAGNNWPLRGNKTTLWEGGTRGVAFVHSPLLPTKGKVSNKLIHVTDWFATLVGLGGGTVPEDTHGHDQWEAIATQSPSHRKEMVYNIDTTHEMNAGIRMGDYKLLVGDPGPGDWTPPPEGYQYSEPEDSNPEESIRSNQTVLETDGVKLTYSKDDVSEYDETIHSESAIDVLEYDRFQQTDSTSNVTKYELFHLPESTSDVSDYKDESPLPRSKRSLLVVADIDVSQNSLDSKERDLSQEVEEEILLLEKTMDALKLNHIKLRSKNLRSKGLRSIRLKSKQLLSKRFRSKKVKSMNLRSKELQREELISKETKNEDVRNEQIGSKELGDKKILHSLTSSHGENKKTVPDTMDVVTFKDLGLQMDNYRILGQMINDATPMRLYNVIDDPEERTNLALEKPTQVKILLDLIQNYMKDYVNPDILPNNPAANPIHWNNTWSPGWCQSK